VEQRAGATLLKGPASQRTLAALLLIIGLAGCATWRPYGTVSDVGGSQDLPYRLRAERTDSSRLTLTSPFARGDTLFGRVQQDTVGIPLTDIVKLERERIAWDRTVLMVVGIPVAAFGLTYAILCSSSCEATY
jgi:hypothetical protein